SAPRPAERDRTGRPPRSSNEPASTAGRSTDSPRPPKPGAPGMVRILCVEDDPIVRGLVVTLLKQQADFEVLAAVKSVTEALEHLTRSPVDVVVLDWILEDGETGQKLLEALANWETQVTHIPRTLVCTGYGSEVAATAQAWGARGLVDKRRLAADLV